MISIIILNHPQYTKHHLFVSFILVSSILVSYLTTHIKNVFDPQVIQHPMIQVPASPTRRIRDGWPGGARVHLPWVPLHGRSCQAPRSCGAETVTKWSKWSKWCPVDGENKRLKLIWCEWLDDIGWYWMILDDIGWFFDKSGMVKNSWLSLGLVSLSLSFMGQRQRCPLPVGEIKTEKKHDQWLVNLHGSWM
jgi:hypothetical protein